MLTNSCANITATHSAALRQASARPTTLANLLLIEHDDDCADALDVLLRALPGVRSVRVASSAQQALAALMHGQLPDMILLDACRGDVPLITALQALRVAAPRAVIVLLAVYPEALLPQVATLVDATISKDTRRSELVEVLERLRAAHD